MQDTAESGTPSIQILSWTTFIAPRAFDQLPEPYFHGAHPPVSAQRQRVGTQLTGEKARAASSDGTCIMHSDLQVWHGLRPPVCWLGFMNLLVCTSLLPATGRHLPPRRLGACGYPSLPAY